jgi:DNA-binding NtrC family response regulator
MNGKELKIKPRWSRKVETVPNVLIAGASDKVEILRGLSIRLFVAEFGSQAIRCLKRRKISTLISRWELVDVFDGELLKKVIAAKPDITTIALIKAGDYLREVAARSTGVSIVLPEDIDNDHFRDAVCQLVHISGEPTDPLALKIEDVESSEVMT